MAEIAYCIHPSSIYSGSSAAWYVPPPTYRNNDDPLHDEADEWIIEEAPETPQSKSRHKKLAKSATEIFFELADQWQRETGHLSSLDDIVANKNYREIVDLDWQIVPALLLDLEHRHRFWFPALEEITGIRPFDSRDSGNGKAMTKAWIEWGKRKGLLG
jgi:hypothetical protein